MIMVQSESKQLAPVVLCDSCGEVVKGEGEGWLLTLTRDNGRPHTSEVFFAHDVCRSSFEAQHDAPPGCHWSRLPIQRFLELLAINTTRNAVTAPVGKGPRVH